MSMLAEKKRREKWSLNPRGKAWSEDQNKFGQRLMEKMGWKSGQGLGVSSQGQTDIVKTRVKNDNKGLGFKENGEEWLKTTSEFDNLLDELASSREDSGDGSQSETPVSLEDRSKKSRARVHYHKFTRGKDLSRYSEKDLASIIGPDVIKLKTGQESKSDYTQNQVNKGSLKEYFSKKIKSKEGQGGENMIDSVICDDSKEPERFAQHESEGFVKDDKKLEGEGFSKKAKRKKLVTDENIADVSANFTPKHCEVVDDNDNSETEVLCHRKKKRKSINDIKNSSLELEANCSDLATTTSTESNNTIPDSAEQGPLNEYSDIHQTLGLTSKKRKRKNNDHSQDVEIPASDNNKSLLESNIDENNSKKKKRKIKEEETVQSENFDNNITNNSAENVVSEESAKRKIKKSKSKVYQEEHLDIQTECNEDCTSDNLVGAEKIEMNNEVVTKKKKRKSKSEKMESENFLNVQGEEGNEDYSSSNLAVAEEVCKKKKIKKKSRELQDDPLQFENNNMNTTSELAVSVEANSDFVAKKKKKKFKDGTNLQEETHLAVEQTKMKLESIVTSEPTPQCEQVVSCNKSGDLLEVLGRKTRLKNIKKIHKGNDDFYNTEDFMSFGQTNDSKKASAEKDNSMPINTDREECVNVYREYNPSDCRITKDVLRFENKLVQDKLCKLKTIRKPCIIIKDSQNLSKTTVKKLEEVHRVKYYKEFLSKQDVSEINSAVKQFIEDQKNDHTATSKDINRNSVIAKPKSSKKKVERNDAFVNDSDLNHNKQKITTRVNANNNYKSLKNKDREVNVDNKKDNSLKCYTEENPDDCNVPKHVVAYEYRLVSARLKKLEITPPDVKVVVKEATSLNETTRRKLRQIAKTRHLKILLPPDDLTQIEDSVRRFHDSLKPKIEIMSAASKLEEKISEIAEKFDGESESKVNKEEDEKVKGLSKDIEDMSEMLKKLETLVESFRKSKDESNTSEHISKDNSDCEDGDQSESKCAWLKKIDSQLDVLKSHMKFLTEGKRPPGLKIIKNSQAVAKKNKKISERVNSNQVKSKNYQTTSYSRGRSAYNVKSNPRGRGTSRIQSGSKTAVPFGGWGVLRSYASETESEIANGYENFRGNCYNVGGSMEQDRGFSERGGLPERGRGFMGRGMGGFRGRGGMMGMESFRGRGGMMGMGSFRGRGDMMRMGGFRGRGGMRGVRGFGATGDMRGRGRISQNNLEAKLYAEKCKELNKVPEVFFNGVNMKGISGYPANTSTDNTNTSSYNDPGNQQKTPGGIANTVETVAAVNTTKTMSGGFSEVVVRKDG